MFGRRKRGEIEYAEASSAERDEAIRRLERERERINLEIEGVLKMYAKESGTRSLSKRRHKMGKSPNDYSFGEDGKKLR